MNSFSSCITKFQDIWTDSYGNRSKLYDLWDYISFSNDASIVNSITKIAELSEKYWHEDLMKYFPGWNGTFQFIAPEPGQARGYFKGWTEGRKMNEDYIFSFSVLVCFLCLYSDKLAKDYPFFRDKKYPKDEILDYFCEIVDITNEHDILKIKTTEEYLVPTVFGTLLHCQKTSEAEKKGKELLFDSKTWVTNRINQLNHISCNEDIALFQKDYYEALWKECHALDLRDIQNDSFSSITMNSDVADLYVPPAFKYGSRTYKSPFTDSDPFRRIIIANSGAGKSSLLQALSSICVYDSLASMNSSQIILHGKNDKSASYAELKQYFNINKNFLPLLIKAENFNEFRRRSKENLSLSDLFIGSRCEKYTESIENFMDTAHKENRLLLLVDALDELDDENKAEFGQLLDDFIYQYPQTNLIITSRPIEFRPFFQNEFLKDIENWSLSMFDENRVKELIRKWLSVNIITDNESSVENIFHTFMDNRFLKVLTRNPYIFSQALYHGTANASLTPQEILSYVVGKLIEKRWPLQKYGIYGITVKYMRSILSCIAWEMIKSGDHTIPAQELASRFSKAARLVDEDIEIDNKVWNLLVKEMNARAGLLIPEQSGYVFQLELVEHFLAAEWISTCLRENVDQFASKYVVFEEIDKFLPEMICDDNWADIILMLFSPNSGHSFRNINTITQCLFQLLLYRTAETLNEQELLYIARIFIDLMSKTFGTSIVANPNRYGESSAKQRILRFLLNNIMKDPSLSEQYGSLDELIQNRELLQRYGLILAKD